MILNGKKTLCLDRKKEPRICYFVVERRLCTLLKYSNSVKVKCVNPPLSGIVLLLAVVSAQPPAELRVTLGAIGKLSVRLLLGSQLLLELQSVRFLPQYVFLPAGGAKEPHINTFVERFSIMNIWTKSCFCGRQEYRMSSMSRSSRFLFVRYRSSISADDLRSPDSFSRSTLCTFSLRS